MNKQTSESAWDSTAAIEAAGDGLTQDELTRVFEAIFGPNSKLGDFVSQHLTLTALVALEAGAIASALNLPSDAVHSMLRVAVIEMSDSMQGDLWARLKRRGGAQ